MSGPQSGLYAPWRGKPSKAYPWVVSSFRGPIGAYAERSQAIECAKYFAEYGAYVGSFEGDPADVREVVEVDGRLTLRPVAAFEPAVVK